MASRLTTKRKLACFDILAVFVACAIAFVNAFNEYDVGSYVDGGYYYLQVQELHASSQLYFESPPLVFYIAALLGEETIGLAIASSLVLGLQPLVYFVSLRAVHSRSAAYLTLPFTAWNAVFCRMYGDFAKNVSALLFLPLLLACVYCMWKQKRRIFAIGVLITSFCMGLSHLPTTLLGLISAGTVAILLLFCSLDSGELLLKQLRDKDLSLKTLTENRCSRLIFGVILAGIGGGLALLVNHIVPVKPSTFYSSSEIPASTYGDSEESVTVMMFKRLYEIQHAYIALFLFVLLLLRPKGWQIPIAVFGSAMAIDVSICSGSWTHRLDYNLEMARLFLMSLVLAQMVTVLVTLIVGKDSKAEKKADEDPATKETRKDSRQEPSSSHLNFHSRELRITVGLIACVSLLLIPLVSNSLVFEHQNIVSEEQYKELETIGQVLQATFPQEDTIAFAPHGLEYWMTASTGYECEELSTRGSAFEYFSALNSTDHTSLAVFEHPFPPYVQGVPLFEIGSKPVGPWGAVNSPGDQGYLGSFHHSIAVQFSPPPSTTIANATVEFWNARDAGSPGHVLHAELLNVTQFAPTLYLLMNERPDLLATLFPDFAELALVITVEFTGGTVAPFELRMTVYGGNAPFSVAAGSPSFNVFVYNTEFRIEDPSGDDDDLPPNQQIPPYGGTPNDADAENSFFDDWIILFPFNILDGLYLRLLVAWPIFLSKICVVIVLLKSWIKNAVQQ